MLAQPAGPDKDEAEVESNDVDMLRAGMQELDGCPVVCLHGDSPVDVENLLYALYDGP